MVQIVWLAAATAAGDDDAINSRLLSLKLPLLFNCITSVIESLVSAIVAAVKIFEVRIVKSLSRVKSS